MARTPSMNSAGVDTLMHVHMVKATGARRAQAMPIPADLPRLVPLSGARSCCHHAALKIKNPTTIR